MFAEDRHKSELKHECELPPEDDISSRFIMTGYFVGLRRFFRNCLVVDQNNPRSRSFFRSTFIITREKINHLRFNYYMIHPFSSFRSLWESLQVITMICQLILIPLHIVVPLKPILRICQACDVMTVMDIIFNFNTGFQNKVSNTIILHRQFVARHYLYTTFILDLLSLIHYEYLEWISLVSKDVRDFLAEGQYIELLNAVKLLRAPTLFTYIDSVRDSYQMNVYSVKICKVALLILIFILWTSGMTYIYTAGNKRKTLNVAESVLMVMICIRRVIFMLHLFGVSHYSNEFPILVCQMICLLLGFILHLLVLCQILQIRTKYSWSTKKFHQMTKQLNEYMRFKSLPPTIQARILKYCDFRFQLNYYKEVDIMKILSPQLQQEVMLQAHVHLLSKVSLFEDIPVQLLFEIIYQMKVNYYLPSDVIITAGSHTEAMYFINIGSVAVYTSAGKEVTHLVDGDHFGELTFMGDSRNNLMTIIAIDCCEVYVLERSDFIKQLSQHDEVYEKVKKYMKEYVAKMHWDDMADDYEDTSITDRY